jgi:SAM-dependent methyltransferase
MVCMFRRHQERQMVDFDQFSSDYDTALAEGLSVTGEDKHYFARVRLAWLARGLAKFPVRAKSLIDYGCGTGTSAPLFFELLGAEEIIGLDTSVNSLAVARKTHNTPRTKFYHPDEYQPCGQIDLTFCNGVFHHIPPEERAGAVSYIYRCLRPGGIFAIWENNPWNPGTRYVMSRVPFDRDAVMLSHLEMRRIVKECGFEALRTDFLFIFPRALKFLRWIEPLLSSLPLGGQYQVLCRKPE